MGQDTLSSDTRVLPFLARYEYTSTNVEDAPELPSSEIRVLQYPNPFTDATTIGFELPTETHVRLRVYDLLGREIATLVDDFRHTGQHRAVFRKEGLPSGTYVYRLEALGRVQLGADGFGAVRGTRMRQNTFPQTPNRFLVVSNHEYGKLLSGAAWEMRGAFGSAASSHLFQSLQIRPLATTFLAVREYNAQGLSATTKYIEDRTAPVYCKRLRLKEYSEVQ